MTKSRQKNTLVIRFNPRSPVAQGLFCSVLEFGPVPTSPSPTPLLQGAPVPAPAPRRARLPSSSTSGMECPIARPYICFAHTAPICADLPCYSVL